MSPSLGFASTAGAFIGGAARQLNANMEAEQAQEHQNDVLWMAKFAAGENAYQKERKEAQDRTLIYNTALKQAGGNAELADAYMTKYLQNPKDPSLNQYFNDLGTMAASGKYTPDPNYQSEFLRNTQAGLSDRYSYLQGIKNNIRPNMQKFMTLPTAPGQAQQPTVGNYTPSDQQQPIGQPTQLASADTTQTAQAQSGQRQPFQFTTPIQKTNATDPQDSNTWKNYANRDAWEQDAIRHGMDPKVAAQKKNGIITAEELNKQKIDQYNIEHPTAGRTKYQDVYATQLEKNIAGLQNASELATDASNAITMIRSGGLKTNATQPVFDMFNRVLSSMGADDLQKLGLANKVSDYNMLQKVITRMQFGQIPNYHLGRWTEREVAMLNNMIASGRTDENTNIKILLLIKNNSERTMRHIDEQAQAAGSGSPKELTEAMKIRANQLKELADPAQRLPWVDVNLNKPEDYEKWKQAKPGTWFNDINTGTMSQKPMQ